MNCRDLEEILRLAEVDPTYYRIRGEQHEALCISQGLSDWRVFIGERGNRFEERAFDTEDGACVYFLKRIFQLWHRTDSR